MTRCDKRLAKSLGRSRGNCRKQVTYDFENKEISQEKNKNKNETKQPIVMVIAVAIVVGLPW